MRTLPMAITGLTIIGESINDSVPSTHSLYEANELEAICELAKFQAERGAAYIDVNVGSRPAEFMAELVRRIQRVTDRPLSIDTPDPVTAAAGLDAYDPSMAGGKKPILNSISLRRTEMLELMRIRAFRPILLISESSEGACHTSEETVAAAVKLREMAERAGVVNEEMIFDPGIAPIGTDSEGNLVRLMAAMTAIHADPRFTGVHASVGLSNFTVMLPAKRKCNGLPVKGPLESAFLTRAMPLGLDTVIGSVKRNYRKLAEGDDALVCFDECLNRPGFDSIRRVRSFYR
ncbi:MAG: dihydropteroate synthase [Planctomycetia bacterium]|nr:dihydropteroate synthase [Planctomycetia bacterium]